MPQKDEEEERKGYKCDLMDFNDEHEAKKAHTPPTTTTLPSKEEKALRGRP